jgi:hypothetical protein
MWSEHEKVEPEIVKVAAANDERPPSEPTQAELALVTLYCHLLPDA